MDEKRVMTRLFFYFCVSCRDSQRLTETLKGTFYSQLLITVQSFRAITDVGSSSLNSGLVCLSLFKYLHCSLVIVIGFL